MFLRGSALQNTEVSSLSGLRPGIPKQVLQLLRLCCYLVFIGLEINWIISYFYYFSFLIFFFSTFKHQESLPPEYARIFAFDNFARTQKLVHAKAQEMEEGTIDECASAGSYVRLHIKEVPYGVASKLYEFSKVGPVVASGLLQHESKISVLHFRYLLAECLYLYLRLWCLSYCLRFWISYVFDSIKKHETYTAPIKAKEELIFHVGFRQFCTR